MQTASTATIRPDLADGLTEYSKNLMGQFMATKVLPLRPVDKKSGTYGKILIAQLTGAAGDPARSPGAAYRRLTHEITTDNYTCAEYGYEETVDDGEGRVVGEFFPAAMEAVQLCRFKLMRAQEIRAAAAVFNATTFASYTGAVTTEWNTAASATPYADIQDAKLTLLRNVGGAIDGRIGLAVSYKVFKNILKTTEIKALISGGNGAEKARLLDISQADLATILGIDDVFTSAAQSAGADIWDDEYAMLFIHSTGALSSSVQMGRTFQWSADCPSEALVESYREESIRSNVYRVRQFLTEKITIPAAGYLLSNITT
jgi:hypothetical protein